MTDSPHSGAETNKAAANAAALEMIALVEQLSQVIDEENGLLAEGVPGNASHVVARKRELADRFSACIAGLRATRLRLEDADPWLQMRLHDDSKLLRGRMNDNVDGLRRSLAATQRRIDAIMRAIREQATGAPRGYGADARAATVLHCASTRLGRIL